MHDICQPFALIFASPTINSVYRVSELAMSMRHVHKVVANFKREAKGTQREICVP